MIVSRRIFGLSASVVVFLATLGCSTNSSVQAPQANLEAGVDRAIAPEIVGAERAEIRAAMLRLSPGAQALLNARTTFFLIKASPNQETIYVNHPALRGALVRVVAEQGGRMGRYPDGHEIALPPDLTAAAQPASKLMPATSSCGPTVPLSSSGVYRALVSCIDASPGGGYSAQVNVACNNTISAQDGAYIYLASYVTIAPPSFGRETGLFWTTKDQAWQPYIKVPTSLNNPGGMYVVTNTPLPPGVTRSGSEPGWEWKCSDPNERQLVLGAEEAGYDCSNTSHKYPWPCPAGDGNPQITLVYYSCEYNSALGNCSGGTNIYINYQFTSPTNGSTADGYPYYLPLNGCTNCVQEYVTSIAYGGSMSKSTLGAVYWGYTGVGPTDTLACVDNPPWLPNEPNQTAECKTGPPAGGNNVIQVPTFGVDYTRNPNGLYYQSVSISAPQ